MNRPYTIDVLICTFRRAHIVHTLESIAQQQLPDGATIRVIVADNDEEPSAQILVQQAAKEHHLALTYVHAPARNISIARNACLDAATADFVAFIDDDEIASPHWLKALMETQRTSFSPVVLGPACAIYDTHAPRWVTNLDLHSTTPVWVNGIITTGYSTNVLIERAHPALAGLRFRLDFGVSGGEDTDYFSRAHKAGATIVFAPDALTFEGVPIERCTMAWLKNRRYRCGETHGILLLEDGQSRTKNIVKAIAKLSFCSIMACVAVLSPTARRGWLLRGALHRGVMDALRKNTTTNAA